MHASWSSSVNLRIMFLPPFPPRQGIFSLVVFRIWKSISRNEQNFCKRVHEKNLIFFLQKWSPVIIIQYVTEKHGALAQLGERYTGSVEVSGSSPLCSTKGKPSDVPGGFYIFGFLYIRMIRDQHHQKTTPFWLKIDNLIIWMVIYLFILAIRALLICVKRNKEI